MMSDDILLYGRYIEIPDRILTCNRRMGEAVQASALLAGLVPVVKEVVVKQRPSYESLPVHLYAQYILEIDGKDKAEFGHGKSVLEHGCRSVLSIILHLLSLVGHNEVTAQLEDLLGNLVFRNLFAHGFILLRI